MQVPRAPEIRKIGLEIDGTRYYHHLEPLNNSINMIATRMIHLRHLSIHYRQSLGHLIDSKESDLSKKKLTGILMKLAKFPLKTVDIKFHWCPERCFGQLPLRAKWELAAIEGQEWARELEKTLFHQDSEKECMK